MSSKQEHPLQAMGFWMFGFLSLVLAVFKHGDGILVVVEGDAAIPGVSGPQRSVSPGGFLYFCWLKHEEDEEEPTAVQKHSREGYNIAARLFFPLFLDNLLLSVERTRLEGVLAVLGEIRGGGPVWDVESGGTVCALVADCQRPQSRARLKPETTTVTFEKFGPARFF